MEQGKINNHPYLTSDTIYIGYSDFVKQFHQNYDLWHKIIELHQPNANKQDVT